MNDRLLYRMAVFALVVEEGSFVAAARRLGRAPSVTSTQVKALEQDLGVTLLYRTTRRISMTTTGERFLPACQQALSAVQAVEDLQHIREEATGPLTVSAPGALMEAVVMPAVARLHARSPRVEVTVLDEDHRSDLLAGGVDVAVRVGPLRALDHRARHLGYLTERRVVPPTAQGGVVLLPWQAERPDASRLVRTSSVRSACAAVRAGLGEALLPETVIEREGLTAWVADTPATDPIPFYAVHAQGRLPAAAVRWFVDAAWEAAAPWRPPSR